MNTTCLSTRCAKAGRGSLWWIGAAALALLTGCSYLGTARGFDADEFGHDPNWVAVEGVPEIRQESAEDCGAAALAMVLQRWGVREDREAVLAACPPVRGGIRAADLRAHARSKGLSAYLFHGRVEDFERELNLGRPLIVGMVKPHVRGRRHHYEVVVAWHPRKRIVVTLDPAAGWRQNELEGFLEEWESAGRLTLLVFEGPEGDRGISEMGRE